MSAQQYSKQCVLLDTYSKMVGLTNPIESDFAKCAAEYINLARCANDSFLLSIINRARLYMANELADTNDNRNISMDSGIDNSPSYSNMNMGDVNDYSENYILEEDSLNIFCEGTSTGIGTSGACSGCGIYATYKDSNGEVKEVKKKYILSNSEPASNQRAELSTFYAGLDLLEKIKKDAPHLKKFYVHITSKYAYSCVNEWGHTWASKRWKRADGPIKNVDIIRPLYERLQNMPQVKITLYQRDKTKKTDNAPEWFNLARDLAIQAISISKNQNQSQENSPVK
jgi:ribonuclease HI